MGKMFSRSFDFCRVWLAVLFARELGCFVLETPRAGRFAPAASELADRALTLRSRLLAPSLRSAACRVCCCGALARALALFACTCHRTHTRLMLVVCVGAGRSATLASLVLVLSIAASVSASDAPARLVQPHGDSMPFFVPLLQTAVLTPSIPSP